MDDGILVVTFDGTQTIEKAATVKKTLVSAIKSKKKEILINLINLEKVDLSFLQLLYSASLEAGKSKKKMSINGDVSDSILDIISLTGFNRTIGQDSNHIFSIFKGIEE